ncbi:MAG: FAD-dependent monooxygenase [Acidimicrobiales bacterium]
MALDPSNPTDVEPTVGRDRDEVDAGAAEHAEHADHADHAVVIAGGGPTGLMLAAELALAGTEVVIVERRTDQELDSTRAGGLHARTIEVLDQRGVGERFVSEGQPHPAVGFSYVPLPVGDFPTRHPYVLALWQRDIERILATWVDELGVPVLRSREVVGLAQDDDGVDVELSDGTTLRAQYLVGCDGGRSVVRKAAGIDFPGLDASASWIIGEVDMSEEPEVGTRREGGGIGPVDRVNGGNPYNVVLREPEVDHDHEPTLDDLRAALLAAYGTDFGAHDPKRISRFTDQARQAATYRNGRVLLAGDAAHVHPPQGGQGLNIGVQDAVNLGWKLAAVVAGTAPDTLLDTYHDERHPIGARVLDLTSAQVALQTPDDRHPALLKTLTTLLAMDEPRRHMAGMLTGLDVHYDLDGDHPLVGRRMPDLDLTDVEVLGGPGGVDAAAVARVGELLHDARPVLLDLRGSGPSAADPWADRVRSVSARTDGPWELPVIGAVDAPAVVLIRPDGHVAWVGDPSDPDAGDPTLPAALERWFGPPTPTS